MIDIILEWVPAVAVIIFGVFLVNRFTDKGKVEDVEIKSLEERKKEITEKIETMFKEEKNEIKKMPGDSRMLDKLREFMRRRNNK